MTELEEKIRGLEAKPADEYATHKALILIARILLAILRKLPGGRA